jgi:hypothetical protein
MHKESARNNANHEHLVTLTFSKEAWRQLKKIGRDEIELDGKMFDVKSIQKNESEIKVIGHYDTKEDALVAKCDSSHKDNSLKKSSFTSLLLFVETMDAFNFFKAKNYTTYNDSFILAYFGNPLSIESPPPQFM